MYKNWIDMKQRCFNKNNPRYKDWGGRGIKVCDRWMKFENFLADMGEKPEDKTLDRIDNNGNYCPENCRYATSKQQQNNTRQNRLIIHKGKTQNLTQWSKELKIEGHKLYNMLNYKKSTIIKDKRISKKVKEFILFSEEKLSPDRGLTR